MAALLAACRISSFAAPVGLDTGQYLYVADVVLDGDAPYADAANNKGPLTYLLFALIRLTAETSALGVRLWLLPFAVVAAFAVGAYARAHAGAAAGVLATLVFALFGSAAGFNGEDPNTLQFGVPLFVVAWWLATRPGRGPAAGAGAALAAALLVNPALAVTVPVVAFELWRANPSAPDAVRRLGVAAAAGLAVALPLVAWLLAAGALDDGWDIVFGQVRGTLDGSVDQHGRASDLPAFDVPVQRLWLLAIAGVGVAATDRRLRRPALTAGALIVLVWARTKSFAYEYPHHYYPALPGMVVAVALGVVRAWRWLPERRPWLRWALVAVLLAEPFWQVVVEREREMLRLPAERRAGQAATIPAAEFVRERTRPGDRILVVGAAAEVYWLSGRRSVTPYFDVFGLGWKSARGIRARRRDVERTPPAAVVALAGAELVDPSYRELLGLREYRIAFRREGARVWLPAG